ncbi:putative phytanoyl-CoA dioxygenase [Glandiceps talaboti]
MSEMITEDIIHEYEENGAVCLRGVFDQNWIQLVEAGINKNLANPSQYSECLKGADGPGSYFNDYCNWQKIEEFEKYAKESPAAAIVGKLMKTQEVVFYHEHVLTKDPDTSKVTPWHHDQAYYPVDGNKVCSIWMPIDHVSIETSIQYVRGSHRWGKWFHPRKFATSLNYGRNANHTDDKIYEDMPDIDKEIPEGDILKWEMQPGDCVVFHMLTVHGAPANTSLTTPRRVLSTRWVGDDAVIATRPWDVSPPITGGLRPGDRVLCDTFPLIWKG